MNFNSILSRRINLLKKNVSKELDDDTTAII